MSRYIDADALLDKTVHMAKECFGVGQCYCLRTQFQKMIDEQPTVDAVPVCRCKDCKHHEVFKNGINGWCNGHGCPTDVTYFCADGERKDGERRTE